MIDRVLKVGIVGCGNIAGPYAETLRPHPQVKLMGACDVDAGRAIAFAAKYGGRAFDSLEEMLQDQDLDAVVNLTIHHAHSDVIAQCLNAGKHVHSEKPLAMSYPEARRLVELARERGLRLSCSPITFMGEAQQTALKAVRDGKLGQVRLAFAEVNWGRIEMWHPAPDAFYEVGALFDVGVYPLTILTTMFGPARTAWAFGTVLKPDRVGRDGDPFHITTPDLVVAVVTFENGVVARLTTDFYVSGNNTRQHGIELHGDLGSLYLSSWQEFNAVVELGAFGKSMERLPYVKEPFPGTEWARALTDLAEAIRSDRPQRATGAQAAHVVEILCAIQASYQEQRSVEIGSTFPAPPPMPWSL